MTSASDVREFVTGTGPPDWIPFADMETWTYRDDVDLRIAQHEQLAARFEARPTHGVQGPCRQHGYVVYRRSRQSAWESSASTTWVL
jgi:hypothetical protein